MNISERGLQLIQSFEGFRSKAYQDSVGIWTLGFGTIIYPDNTKVKENDVCSELEAQEWLLSYLANDISKLNKVVFNEPLNQNQIDALLSFSYNLGFNALNSSSLLRKARLNPNDESIYSPADKADSCEFTRWCRANGNIIKGLLVRRIKEAELYGEK